MGVITRLEPVVGVNDVKPSTGTLLVLWCAISRMNIGVLECISKHLRPNVILVSFCLDVLPDLDVVRFINASFASTWFTFALRMGTMAARSQSVVDSFLRHKAR